MKALFVIPVLAIILATGCTSGSRGKTVYVNDPDAVPVETTSETEPVVVEIAPPLTVPAPDTRIDPVPIMETLRLAGCQVTKFEYKEVVRGAGIIVTCADKTPDAPSADPLASEGLEGI
jgi:hypothetical protein